MVGAAIACARLGRLRPGREVHCVFLRHFEDDNLLVWTALIDMYGKCRRAGVARKLFDRLRMWNLVCWNAMIIGHCVYGEPGDGIKLFQHMITPGGFRFPRLVIQKATYCYICIFQLYPCI
jgi:pentatricopeptide repeat protein